MRKRIPLARILLQTTIDITKHHPVVYLIALIGLVVQTAVNVWYTFTVIAIYVKWTPNSPGTFLLQLFPGVSKQVSGG